MSFVLLEEVKGTTVSGSNVWYKIQLDTPLNSSRSAIDYSGDGYDFEKSYGYIHSSLLSKTIYKSESGDTDTPTTTYKKGDVNNDGKISSMDYVLVKNHILDIKKLNGSAAIAADVNGDNKISSMDYVLIKNDILGISKIN